jgi:O-antigen ligase
MGMIALWLNFRFMPSYYLERIKISLAQLTQYFQTFDQTLFLQLGTFRGDTWQSAVRTFLQSPIIGHGPGNSLFLNPSNSILSYLRPELAAHNFILSIAGDLGLIGLFFFISLLISALWAVRPYGATKTLKNSLQITRNAIFTGLLACVVQGMALDLHTQKALWILIGMAFAYKRYSSLPVIDHEKVL